MGGKRPAAAQQHAPGFYDVRSISLTLKFVLATAVTMLVGLVAAGILFALFAGREASSFGRIARAEVDRQLTLELQQRATLVASRVAELAAPAVASHNLEMLPTLLAPVLDDSTVTALDVRDSSGTVIFRWQPPAGTAEHAGRPTAIGGENLRAMIATGPGMSAPRSIGDVRVEVAPVAAEMSQSALADQLDSGRRSRLRTAFLWLTGLGLLGVALASALGWWLARRTSEPITQLVKGAERFGQGDYSRPIDIAGNDEFAALQTALERMRQRLRTSTISKNYLTSVLGSMTDAVFVTSPDGVIKLANQAACKILSFGEEELIGKSISAVLDETERSSFDLQQAAQQTSETLIRTRQGQSIPVSFTGSQIASDDPQFQGIIFVARNITERKRAERRIRYLARYDALTKLPNRMQFQHLLQQAIARGLRNRSGVALLYLDIDRFKEVNDTFGHAAGDRTLEILSERLIPSLPKDAIAGRLAGDEFAIFVEHLPPDADSRGPIAHLARSILNEVSKAFQLSGQEVFLTASIGMAFCPRDADNVIDLIRNADAAMYYSKQNGGNTFAFYAPEMNAAAVERLMLKSKLRRALERDELVVRYQPKVDLRSGQIVGAEALLRWRLAGHGDISPSQFIPLAEETNLILDLGEWVLNRVCMDYRAFMNEVRNPGRISLNLSLKQLRQASFILRCRSVFRKHSVSPTSFELEITETTLMADAKRTLRLLDELYAMGLHLSIDDFGTGYSSLSALQQFPIGTLKIDQSFVRDVGEDASDATIVRTIIDMGRSLGMQVIAEGVESARQVQFLREHNCHFAQGRLFGEPLTAEELQMLMARQDAGVIPFAELVGAADNPGLAVASAPRLA